MNDGWYVGRRVRPTRALPTGLVLALVELELTLDRADGLLAEVPVAVPWVPAAGVPVPDFASRCCRREALLTW
jgi:hypothetical protein